MPTTPATTMSHTNDRDVVLHRVFAAPPELVFTAWTDARHIGMWWGPRGFSTTTTEIDVRPGGRWVYTMHGPDGVDYPNWIRYRVVDRPRRLEYEHGGGLDTPANFQVVVDFVATGEGTAVTMRMEFPTAAEYQAVVSRYGALEGGMQHIESLAEHLADLPAVNPPFGCDILTQRFFPATREQVFAAWTDPAKLARWWGPAGFTNEFHTFDLRPGGDWDFTMRAPDGTAFRNHCVFERIDPPGTLLFTHVAPMHWFAVRATFTGFPNGTTLVQFRMRFRTAQERDALVGFIAPANEQNFDRLGEVLAGTR